MDKPYEPRPAGSVRRSRDGKVISRAPEPELHPEGSTARDEQGRPYELLRRAEAGDAAAQAQAEKPKPAASRPAKAPSATPAPNPALPAAPAEPKE